MDILSLNEPPQAPTRRLSRAEAIGASVVLHVCLLLLFVRGVDGLPEPIARWLRAHAARLAAQETPRSPSVDSAEPLSPAEKKPEEKKTPIPPIPLKFAYVRVPEEAQLQKNPDAKRLSDRDRRARQIDKPPVERIPSIDPHSIGDTRDRVIPDPRIKSGRDQPDPAKPTEKGERPEDAAERRAQPPGDAGEDATGKTADEKKEGQANPANPEPPRETVAEGQDPSRRRPPGDAAGRPPEYRPSGGAGGKSGSAVPDLREGTESKFRFDNPGWIAGESVDGTLSFDTKGLPWGEYARKIQVIIRQNWIDRLPLAYRQGQRGVTCQYFVIQKDGTISTIDIVRRSVVPPFDRAASDALRASNPLPPLPPEFNLESEGVTGCFWYNLYPADD